MTATLIGLLTAAGVSAHDAHPEAPSGPYAAVYGGSGTPSSLSLCHSHAVTATSWSVICVSNNPEGARMVARKVADALDGVQHATHAHCRYTVTYVSPPIDDDEDPTGWRWSSTVEVDLDLPRN